MRRTLASVVIAVSVLTLTVAPAAAITKYWVADFAHPFVGLIVFYDEDGEFSHRCSGSLLSPTVFLTAGHCTDNEEGGVMASARIWFQQAAGAGFDPVTEAPDPATGYPDLCAAGTLSHTCATSDTMYNFGFDNFAGFPEIHDVGVVILDQAIELAEYAKLASPGTLNSLQFARGLQDTTFLMSGYGVSYRSPVSIVSFRSRLMAEGQLVNLNSINNAGFNLQTEGNGLNQGGTCGGDSGGPVFYPSDSDTIVGVTSFGLNLYCRGVDFAYRTDRQVVIDWILGKAGSGADDIVIDGALSAGAGSSTSATDETQQGTATDETQQGTATGDATTGPGQSGSTPSEGVAATPVAVPEDPSAGHAATPPGTGSTSSGSQDPAGPDR